MDPEPDAGNWSHVPDELDYWTARNGEPEDVTAEVGDAEKPDTNVEKATVPLGDSAAVGVSPLSGDGLHWHLSRSFRIRDDAAMAG